MFLNLDKKNKNKIAITDDSSSSMTYGEILDFSERFGEIIDHRTLIFIKCRNGIGAVAGFLASLCNRIVPLLIDNGMDQELFESLVNTYQPEYIWEPVCNDLDNVIYSDLGYRLVSTGYSVCKMNPDLSLLLTTSGSTGSPKLVRHSYANVETQGNHISNFFGLNDEDRAMADLPINYTMGLSVVISFLYVGATCCLTHYNVLDPEYWDFWRKNKITVFTNIPYTFEMLDRLKFFKMDFPDLRIITQGGGKLKDKLYIKCAEYATEKNIQFIPTYGQTEGTARMAYLPPEFAMQKICCIGKAIPGGKLWLVNENGEIINQSDVCGEMIYEGPNVTWGYAEKKMDLELGDERSGVLYTGDLAKMDDDGFFYIVGRITRFVKLTGRRISLDDCERIINNQFNVLSACTGDDAFLNVFITESDKAEEIHRYLSDKLKLNLRLIKVFVVDSIPRNSSGKIQYKNLNSSI